ncbi:hypothetical protein HDU97_002017 [Phlyctochytrium planicorne]|nr:hypothetical protein HDU97_002017 [Phlyctochytrium planicorne]
MISITTSAANGSCCAWTRSRTTAALTVTLVLMMAVKTHAAFSIDAFNQAFQSLDNCPKNCITTYIPAISFPSNTSPLTSSAASTFCTNLISSSAADSAISCMALQCESNSITIFSNVLQECANLFSDPSFTFGVPSSAPTGTSKPSITPKNFPTNSPTSSSPNPSTSNSSSNTSSPSSDGKSNITTIAIAVGAVLAVVVIGAIIAVLVYRSRNARQPKAPVLVAAGNMGHQAGPGTGYTTSMAQPPNTYVATTLPQGQPFLMATGQAPPNNHVWAAQQLSPQPTVYQPPLPPVPHEQHLPAHPYEQAPPVSMQPPHLGLSSSQQGSLYQPPPPQVQQQQQQLYPPHPTHQQQIPQQQQQQYGYPNYQPQQPSPTQNQGLFGSSMASSHLSVSSSSQYPSSTSMPMQTSSNAEPRPPPDEKDIEGGLLRGVAAGSTVFGSSMASSATVGSHDGTVVVMGQKEERMLTRADVEGWGAMEVGSWLHGLGLRDDILVGLRDRKIDGHRLLALTDAQLQEYGINQPTVRQSILVNVEMLCRGEGKMEVQPGAGVDGGEVPPPYMTGGRS